MFLKMRLLEESLDWLKAVDKCQDYLVLNFSPLKVDARLDRLKRKGTEFLITHIIFLDIYCRI